MSNEEELTKLAELQNNADTSEKRFRLSAINRLIQGKPTWLQKAAKVALAELIARYHDGHIDIDGKRAICDLYRSLKGEGMDVSDYELEFEAIQEDVNNLE